MALSDVNKAIDLDAKNSQVYIERSKVYLSQMKKDLALADINKAIELDPRNVEAFFTRGLVCEQFGCIEKTIASDYTKAIELNPNYTDAYNKRGWFFYFNSRFNDAIKDATKLIEIAPNDSEGYRLRYTSFSMQQKENDPQALWRQRQNELIVCSANI